MGQRGRRRGSIGVESRNLLLEKAAEEFAKCGFHETKISTIVKRANVTQPSFYLYFSSKDAIFQELVGSFHSTLSDLVQQSRLESGLKLDSLEAEIEYKLTAIFTYFKNNQDLTKIGFYISKDAGRLKGQIAAQIEENLLKEQRDGYFQPDIDMHTVAQSLVGIMERLTIVKLFTGMREPGNLANEIVRLILNGIISR
ncbi:TetR/AcrR family transcriptional regulator [Oceanobacillus massiliensis]|uniref:TetR/AcrR family transcriptional regulator n=1 Tax=Oceanobacillus massiliensis TaxID=1465765 RepID=UPI000287DAC3|nr:TetR/AcrR family transcriptional regulator [Oceanobacillus massiliensis]